MNFELIKELRKAGFPLKKSGESKKKDVSGQTDLVRTYEEYDFPTLSELIEACAEILLKRNTDEVEHSLQVYYNLDSDDKSKIREWGAGYEQTEDGRETLINRSNYFGKTPEEAVARLWLALNK